MPQKRTSRSGAMTSGSAEEVSNRAMILKKPWATNAAGRAGSEVYGEAAHVLLRRAVALVHIEEERRVPCVRDFEAEQELEIDRQPERLRHPEVHALAAILRSGLLRLLQLTVRHREA